MTTSTGTAQHGQETPERSERQAGDSRLGYPLGPLCRHCRANEARCAWQDGCCGACSHTFGEVVEAPVSARRAYFQQRWLAQKARRSA